MTIRTFLSMLILISFGSPLLAQARGDKLVGVGEVCDPAARIECKSGLECNASKPDVAGVCVSTASRTILSEDLGEGVTQRETPPAR